MNRTELLVSYSKKFTIHRRMWETEWNYRNTTGLSYPQFLILSSLYREGPKQSKDLVKYFSITSGGITSIADKLISLGLIRRTRDEQKDRRSVYLEISEEGRAVFTELDVIRYEAFDSMFSCLTDAEIAYLDQIYGKLVNTRRDIEAME